MRQWAWRSIFPVAVLGALVLGLMGRGAADPELALLLRFMALVKGGVALVAAGFVAWRLRAPIAPGMGAIYIAAVAAMAGGAGLIWQLAHVAWGALLVHGGLITLVGVTWLDRSAFASRARNWGRIRPVSGELQAGQAD